VEELGEVISELVAITPPGQKVYGS